MRRMVRSGKRMRRILHIGSGGTQLARRSLAVAGLLAAAATPVVFSAGSSAAPAPVGQGFTVVPSDLAFILKQIKIAERHSATLTASNPCGTLVGSAPNQIPDALTSYGLRTVDGSCNNLVTSTTAFPKRETLGAADQPFPRLTSPSFKDAEGRPAGFFGPGDPGSASSSYAQKKGSVFDSQPRLISNLIVDQTSTNPAAVDAALHPVRTQGNPGIVACSDPPAPTDPAGCVPPHKTLFIPNVTTDTGLSPPFNSIFTFFGQFFDHGVDQTVKSGGTVFVPLRADDPLRTLGPDGIPGNGDEVPASQAFMVVTRGQQQPGPDGILFDVAPSTTGVVCDPLPSPTATPTPNTPAGCDETADNIQNAPNTDTPWVDQSQTYTSHSSHQVFLREYDMVGGKPVATGKLLGGGLTGVENGVDISARHNILQSPGDDQGISTWESVKVQARDKLGLDLHDVDVTNIPMIAADPYGEFIPGPSGLPQYVTKTGLVEGNLAAPVPVPANVLHFDTPFLTDIAHSADPGTVGPCTTAIGVTPRVPTGCLSPDADNVASADFANQPPGTYDDEMLNAHFSCGDGRCNENIALSSIHQIFHSEHDRLVDDIMTTLEKPENASLLADYMATNTDPAAGTAKTFTFGERLFQAARFVTEMEYQHLVFEEFARKIQPAIRPFHVYQPDINPAIEAEFAHAVYRFGHSMLDDQVARTSTKADGTKIGNSLPLLTAFLNPPEYFNNSVDPANATYTPAQAAGAILMGSSDQVGNEIDEFVTETLRNNLLGLPLDLPTINMTRARSEGIPRLNDVRRQIFAETNDGQLAPYTSWSDFGQHLKHPASLINFVAAYGMHPSITAETTIAGRRAAARAIVDPLPTDTPPADAADFMFSTGAWASTPTGLDDVDLWVGGLSEVTNQNGGLLGSTFNYVFQTQLEKLQDGDRLYYLARTPGLNLRTQLEGNSFAEMIQRNTEGTNTLKADVFATADCKFQLASLAGTAGGFAAFGSTVADDPSTTDCNESQVLLRKPDGTIQYRLINPKDPPGINGQGVYNGTPGVDRIFGGVDNDTFWGGLGNDIIEGNNGDDVALGGEGNDIITDLAGADFLKGGPGNDALDAGIGDDVIGGGDGQDFTNGGANDNETFAGPGNDFIIAGQGADAVFGDGGDDWIEGGSGQDLLQGDHGAPFFDDPAQLKPGNDVFIGQVGENDYDAEGGDDVMAQNAAIDRNAGAAGFDWAFHQYDTIGANDDMEINNNLVGLPIQVVVNRDRWQETEADSGSAFNDVIKGHEVAPATIGGAGFSGCDVLDQAGIDRISGLSALLPQPLTGDPAPVIAASAAGFCPTTGPIWGEGDILIGGGGSDTITGRGANDIIDGDRSLSVRISVRTDPANPTTEIGTTDLMEHTATGGTFGPGTDGMTLQQAVFAGLVDPGNLVAVREIGTTGVLPTDVDTAVYRDVRANYDITTNPDGSITVAHTRGAAGKLNDGTDTLRNIERLQFTDQTIPVAGIGVNTPATGAPAITGGAPVAGVPLTATNGTIADAEGIASVSFAWEANIGAGVFVQVGAGPSFTPSVDQVGKTLRVVATVLDNLGGSTVLPSAETAAVAPAAVVGVNVAATGAPVVTDAVAGIALAGRPRVNEPLGTDTTGISDANGLVNVVFNFQWQRSADGGTTWTDIAGAANRTFTPTSAQLGDLLRVHVSFTDNGGFVEALDSTATRDVRPARGRGGRPPVLVLSGLTVPRTVTVATVASAGLPLSFSAPARTTLVRVMVFRVGSKRPLVKQFISAKRGKTNTVLRSAGIKRALRLRGHYRIEITPASSRTALGKTTVRMVTVRR